MISLNDYLVFLAAFSIATTIPGPSIAAIVASVLSRNAKAGILVSCGAYIGNIVWFLVAVLGLSAIAGKFAFILVIIKYAGAAYLLFFAWKLWRAPAQILDQDTAQTDGGLVSNIRLGLLISLGNPKTVMFFVTIFPSLIDIRSIGIDLSFVLFASITIAAACIFGGYVFLTARVKEILGKASAIRSMQRGTSLIMAGAAAVLMVR